MKTSCSLRPKELVLGRLSVNSKGDRCRIKKGDIHYEADPADLVLSGAVQCGDHVVTLTEEELDWLYLHV